MTFAEERNTEEEERERKIPLCSERRKGWRRENTELCITKKINVGSLRRVVIRISIHAPFPNVVEKFTFHFGAQACD